MIETDRLRPASLLYIMGTMPATFLEQSAAGSRTGTGSRVSFKETPEAELVRHAQAGDETAFREIVERHQNKVFAVIFRILRRRNDAEDIAQQVFTKIYFSLNKFDFRSSLSTWIYKIAVNECYDYLRKKKVRRLVYESDMGEEDNRSLENSSLAVNPSIEFDERAEKRDYLVKLLERISNEERMLLFEKEVEGRSVQELAEKTGLNENTIKVKLFRARQKLVKAAAAMKTAV